MCADITQKQIDIAIKNCVWRRDVTGIPVCTGSVLPCQAVIEKGQCDTLIRLFNGNGRSGVENEQ